jgi:beta-alanine--pyruvate transaminase
MAAIELQPRPDRPGSRALDAMVSGFERGLLVRVTGDIIALSPPLIIEKGQVDHAMDVLKAVLLDLD